MVSDHLQSPKIIIAEKANYMLKINKSIIPKWIIHHAYYSNHETTLPYLRLILTLFDIRPNLIKEKYFIKKDKSEKYPNFVGHIHIPKTGGTYVNSLKSFIPYVNLSHVVSRKNRSDKYCPIGLTAIRERKLKSFYLFSIVRNPLNFIISYYHHVKGFEKLVNPYHYDFLAAQKGFNYLVNTIINRTDKWPSRKFLFPQLFNQEGKCIVDWINRTEQLDYDLSKFCNYFGQTFSPEKKKRVSPKTKYPEQYYSDKLYDSVLKIYHREMLIFGYNGFQTDVPKIKLKPLMKDNISYNYLKDEIFINDQQINR